MSIDRHYKVVFTAAEVSPFIKVGGLADVAGALPKALAAMGNEVRVVMPGYSGIGENVTTIMDFPVIMGERKETAIIREGKIEARLERGIKDVPVYFIDNYQYFRRENIYAYQDDAERFTFFCKALLELLPKINFQPDIVHCNDWHTGPIPFLIKEKYRDGFYKNTATIFTIHNLRYQGRFGKDILRFLEVGNEYFHPDSLEFYGDVSFMKAGILYSDIINTVSKRYTQEIKTPEFGEGMDGILRKRAADLYGIVNGINIHEFDPVTDPRIYKNYSADEPEDKKENKYALQREMRLPIIDIPVIGVVSRLVDQKGIDLILQAIDELMKLDIQLVILGAGDPYYEGALSDIKGRYPEKMGLFIGFNGILAQKIYAGADMFLMPSRFEPCGLGQLISMRYGTVPVVRATGGLADTVIDYNFETGNGSGFVFENYDAGAMINTLKRALKLYNEYPQRWHRLVKHIMKLDFSWYKAGSEYIELYEEAISRKKDFIRIA